MFAQALEEYDQRLEKCTVGRLVRTLASAAALACILLTSVSDRGWNRGGPLLTCLK